MTDLPFPKPPFVHPVDGPSTIGFFSEAHHGLGVVVSVTGDIDMARAPALQRRLAELLCLPVDSLTVDMSGVEFMDSSGLNVLNQTRIDAKERNVSFALASVPRQAQQVLELVNMDGIFDIR